MTTKLVITPGGRRPADLVHIVEPGRPIKVSKSGEVAIRRYRADATEFLKPLLAAPLLQNPATDGWVAWASWQNNTGRPITSFTSTWAVPPAPTTDSGQLVYLFNALEDDISKTILQPVLQWGVSPSGGGPGWFVGSWFVQSNGHAFSSPMVPVLAGQVLVGTMTLRLKMGVACNYTCEFQGIPNTSLLVDSVPEMTQATETLEVYGVNQRSDYPNTPSTLFSAIQIRTNAVVAPIPWNVEIDPRAVLGEHAVSVPAGVEVFF